MEDFEETEPPEDRVMQKLNADMIVSALEKGGAIAKRLPEYESRKSQLDLMRLIIRGFNEDALVAAEAGTGVGKSFAYLLPALSYAVLNDTRIIISTATITLQQQLYEKDIPLVLSGLNKTVTVVLMKGRGNYLCFRRLDEALREQYLFEDAEYQQVKDIAVWARTASEGCRSDLRFVPAETVWSRVCSEADACMGVRCPERSRCFVLALRRKCAEAQVLVVNHHLLFADLAARYEGAGYTSGVVLPPYNRVIIDEAHTIEASATSFFSEEFSRLGLYRQLGRLYRKRWGSRAGLLVQLMAFEEEKRLDELDTAVEEIRAAAEALDKAALELCKTDGVFRLTLLREGAIRKTLKSPLADLRRSLNELIELVKNLLDGLPRKQQDDPAVWEARVILRRFETVGSICEGFIDFKTRSGEVLWIERRGAAAGGDGWAVFRITPIDVAPSLKAALFEPNKTVVCVSATLTIKGSFGFWGSRSGFSAAANRNILTGQFPSPFPYASSVLLAIPEDAPLPDDRNYRNFVDAATVKLALSAGGSALILFTSYDALRSAHSAAAPALEQQGIRCLKQGDDDRNRLLQAFLQDEKSVLFATDSFWEGVDAPGDTLRLVILCRLPFKTPNDPVFEARCELLERNGGNSFMELSLPESVVKFKQGFGRLMRRSSDHGVVAVLDGRVLHKRYGDYFLRSLPKTKTAFSNFEHILKEIRAFLASPPSSPL